jgi:hypothetical protein
MFANRYFILLGSAALMLVILLGVQRVLARPVAVSDMDSATQSYSAWALKVEGAAIPATGNAESPDYYQRHPALRRGLPTSTHTILPPSRIDECFDVSISELAACREATQSDSQ